MITPPTSATDPYSPPDTALLTGAPASLADYPVEYATFWPRAVARIVDTCIHIAASLVGGLFLGIAAAVYSSRTGVAFDEALATVQPGTAHGFLLGLLTMTLFHTLCEGVHGSSPGKLVRGLVVLNDDFQPCSLLPALKRSLAYIFDSFFFGAVAASRMSESPKRKRFGDEWARTVVVWRRSAPPGSLRSGWLFTLTFVVAFILAALIVATPAILTIVAA